MQNLEHKNKTMIKTITAVKKQPNKLCQQNTRFACFDCKVYYASCTSFLINLRNKKLFDSWETVSKMLKIYQIFLLKLDLPC